MKKALSIILFSAVFLCGAIMRGQAQDTGKLTLSGSSVTYLDIFNAIKKQTGYTVFYDNSVLNDREKIAVNFSQTDLKQVLTTILSTKKLTWTVNEQLIVLKKNTNADNQPGNTDRSAARTRITGIVTDKDDHLPLPGVTVKIKDETTSGFTDGKGFFSINAPAGATLVFSSIGYQSTGSLITGNTVNVEMVKGNSALTEVVVIGYGTQRKGDLSNAVSSMTAAQIEKQTTGNVLDAMEGQMPGVEVRQGDGRPGSNPTVRIRGTGSVNASNAPLYVVDGLPLEDASDINSLNPNDIATIDVLKDAASAAIYGSRGGNGVVLITTKKGTANKTKFDFSFYTGAANASKHIDVLDKDDYIKYIKEGNLYNYIQSGGNPATPNPSRPSAYRYPAIYDNPDNVASTDWQKEIFRTAVVSNYQAAAQGGTDKATYYISGNYFYQQGILKATDLKRYAFRGNVNVNLNKYMKAGFNITPTFGKENIRATDGHFNGSVGDGATLLSALMMPPTIPAHFPDGTYGQTLGTSQFPGSVAIVSPIQKLENPDYMNYTNTYRVQGIAFIEVDPLKNLSYKMSFGGDYRNGTTYFFRPSTVSTSSIGVLTPENKTGNIANIAANNTNVNANNFTWDNQVSYNTTIAQDHHLSATAVYSIQKSNTNTASETGLSGTFANDLVKSVQGATTINGTYASQEWSLISYLARVSYDYKNKYLLTSSFRRDGTSRFAPGHQWGTFPSVSAGWRIAEEDFMKPITAISELKLRASYGITGNFSIGNYAWQSILGSSNYNFGAGDGTIAAGFAPSNFTNPNLTWETNKQFGLGLDIGLLKDRISLSADIYRRVTSNLLYNRPIPGDSGFGQYLGNIGSIENKGIELDLKTTNIRSNAFMWSTDLNFSLNRNKVLKLGENNEPIVTTTENTVTQLIEVGQPFAVFFGFPTAGVFKNAADVAAHPDMKFSSAAGPGDTKFVDTNHDGVITDADRVILGNPTPNFSYGITNNFSYKRFDLSVQMQGVEGGDIYFLGSRFIGTETVTQNQLAVAANNRWKSEAEPGDGNYPRINSVGITQSNVQRYLYDGSYLRIRNITFGYTMKPGLLKRIGISALRIYATGQNLFTFTKYIGYNPEVNQYGEGVTHIGIDYGIYPLSRSYTCGVNLSF